MFGQLTTKTAPSFGSSVGRAQGWKPWGRWFEPSSKHIVFSSKFLVKYILIDLPFLFVNNRLHKERQLLLLLNGGTLTYFILHLRLASVFYTTQLVDIFAYELITNGGAVAARETAPQRSTGAGILPCTVTTTVYNFHSLTTQDRFFIFVTGVGDVCNNQLSSISELFSAANWLEREVSEFYGVGFSGKKDLRNLLLAYGDSTTPLRKSFPTLGLREIFYDPIKDALIQCDVSTQV